MELRRCRPWSYGGGRDNEIEAHQRRPAKHIRARARQVGRSRVLPAKKVLRPPSSPASAPSATRCWILSPEDPSEGASKSRSSLLGDIALGSDENPGAAPCRGQPSGRHRDGPSPKAHVRPTLEMVLTEPGGPPAMASPPIVVASAHRSPHPSRRRNRASVWGLFGRVKSTVNGSCLRSTPANVDRGDRTVWYRQ